MVSRLVSDATKLMVHSILKKSTQAGASIAMAENHSSGKLYAPIPPSICIKTTKERGRGLWTTVAIPAGTCCFTVSLLCDTVTSAHLPHVGSVIFTAKPHAHVVSKKSMDKYCANCGEPRAVTDLKKCGKCKTVHYCGEVRFTLIIL